MSPALNLRAIFHSLLLWLLVTSGLAMFWPAEQVGFDPFLATPTLLWSLIVVTMLAVGMLVRGQELLPLRQHPWWVMLGVGTQMIVMPAAAWLVIQVVPMPGPVALGVILVGCVPGAMASNVLTNTAGGSVAFSVCLTVVATLLSPLSVPLVLWVIADVQADTMPAQLMAVSKKLFFGVALPTVVGYGLARCSETVKRWAEKRASMLASLALLWIIASVVAANRDRLVDVGVVLVLALLVINLVGYASGYAIAAAARLPAGFRKALTLEVGMQNAGLGTALAVSLPGADATTAIPTAAYTLGCMMTGTLLAVFWRQSRVKER